MGEQILTDEEVSEILDSGDPDQINELLESMEETEDGFEFKDVSTEQDADGEDVSKDDESDSAKADDGTGDEAEGDQSGAKDGEGEEAPYVEGKHGSHKIPYEVLENERLARQKLELRNQELEQSLATQDNKLQRQLAMLTSQLESNGLDPEALPEDLVLTDELKQTLTEDYGSVGKMFIALKEQVDSLAADTSQQSGTSDNQTTTETAQQAVDSALERNGTLTDWFDNDLARKDAALSVDELLRNDPTFKNSSLDERFTEVVRRVQAMFGDKPASQEDAADSVKDKANRDKKIKQAEADADATAAVPASLSDMGAGDTSAERPLVERMADMSMEEVTDLMADMTTAQREKLLAQLD